MKLAAGQVIDYKPDNVLGKDGKRYDVVTMQAGGRGWYSRCFYAVVKGKNLQVKILGEGDKPNLYNVQILSSDMQIVDYAKNPYVRKDGTFNHISDNYIQDLHPKKKDGWGVYAVHNGEYVWDDKKNKLVHKNKGCFFGLLYISKDNIKE